MDMDNTNQELLNILIKILKEVLPNQDWENNEDFYRKLLDEVLKENISSKTIEKQRWFLQRDSIIHHRDTCIKLLVDEYKKLLRYYEELEDKLQYGEPIKIRSMEDLGLIGTHTNYPINGYYVLENNLDASEYMDEWEPIGPVDNPFTGVFDGKFRKIKNFKFGEKFFENIEGTLKNLEILS